MTLPPQGQIPGQDPTQVPTPSQIPTPGPTPPDPPRYQPGHAEPPTQRFPGYTEASTQKFPGYAEPAARQFPGQPFPPSNTAPEPANGRRHGPFGDPLTVALSVVIALALGAAALLGGEFYARRKADSVVANAVSCVVQDSATASFGLRPFLFQHLTRHYHDMRVETAGNQIRGAKGMKLQLRLDDVRINKTADSTGTLGSLDADITWSADGIKNTVAGMIPLIGGLVSGVTPEPASGTLQVDGPLGTVTIKPEVVDGGIDLQVLQVTGLGFRLPRETAQPALDAFTGQLTKNLPMGIHAESVQVTDTGVAARFVTHDATIPNAQQDPCFAGI